MHQQRFELSTMAAWRPLTHLVVSYAMSGRCNGRQDVANKLESSVAGREDWMERSGGTTRRGGRYVEVGCGTVYVPGSPRRYVLMYRDKV